MNTRSRRWHEHELLREHWQNIRESFDQRDLDLMRDLRVPL